MTANGAPRYELRGLSLYVNGERQAVSRRSVEAALACRRPGTGPVEPARGPVEIPAALAGIILGLEKDLALQGLESAVRSVLAV